MSDLSVESAATPIAPAPVTDVERFFSGRDKIAFLVASLVTFAGYLYTLQPSVGLEDSGEFLTAAYHLGVPHPPGYPIWAILSWIWHHIIPFGNIAWRVNLMSAVFGSVAIGLAALLVSKTGHLMGSRVGFLHQLDARVVNLLVLAASVSAALMLAFSPVMWSQSVITEVYALNAFFLMLTLVLLYRWSFEPDRRWRLYLAAFVWGISLTNHQTLVLLTVAFPAFVLFVDRKLGRDVLVPILGVIALGVVYMLFSEGSMVRQGFFSGAVVLGFGTGAAVWLYQLCKESPGVMRQWPQVLLLYGAVLAGLALYAYMHFSSLTNPPMNWGYCSTWTGFVHHFTRGQYEKVFLDRDLLKFWGQLNMFFDDLQSQFNILYALLALLTLFFYRDLDQRDRNWLKFLLVAFLFLGLGFIFLSNPGFEKQKQFTDRVFFLPGHCLYALWIGYGMILGLGYVLSRKPHLSGLMYPMAAAILLLPTVSWWRNWADNEQRGHDFGYQFGYLMFKPGGGYPEMDRNAVLYGGTDPGRFVPTYMIFVESFAPSRAKTRLEKFPESSTFDRRDVYIITQNALADSTYMSYVRDHYDYSRPTNYSGVQRWLGRDQTYPVEPIWIPSEQDSQQAFTQYVQELQQRQAMAEEQVRVEGGKVSVQGVQGVMAINGILTKMIFDKNKDKHAFYVEESYVIPWMNPHLEPFGIIMKINRDEVPRPDQDPRRWQAIIQRDRAYWDALCQELHTNPRFKRDDVAQKTFSKQRSAIGGLYATRGVMAEAEYALRQSIALCPESPEANFRLAQLYLQVGQFEPAIRVLEDYQKTDTYNTKIVEAIQRVREMQQHTQDEREVEQKYAANPNDLGTAIKLVVSYARQQRFEAMDALVNTLLVRPDLPAENILQIAQMYAELKQLERVTAVLTLFTQRFPENNMGWYNLAAVYSARRDCPSASVALQRALAMDSPDGMVRKMAPTDERFANCRNAPEFQRALQQAAPRVPPGGFTLGR